MIILFSYKNMKNRIKNNTFLPLSLFTMHVQCNNNNNISKKLGMFFKRNSQHRAASKDQLQTKRVSNNNFYRDFLFLAEKGAMKRYMVMVNRIVFWLSTWLNTWLIMCIKDFYEYTKNMTAAFYFSCTLAALFRNYNKYCYCHFAPW